VSGLHLTEGCGVEVEPLHAHPDLVRPDLGRRVEPGGRLRERARRVEHPVQTDRRAGGTLVHENGSFPERRGKSYGVEVEKPKYLP
jgi:hypothetical protein